MGKVSAAKGLTSKTKGKILKYDGAESLTKKEHTPYFPASVRSRKRLI